MWFYCTNLTLGTYGLFGQHDVREDFRSLHIEIRDYFPYFGFYDQNLSGDHYLKENIWYHIAFIYDLTSQVRIIYLNGLQIAIGSCQPYQGRSGSITIGKTEPYYNLPTYFDGYVVMIICLSTFITRSYNAFDVRSLSFRYIDEVSLVMRAKSAAEIENNALDHLGPDRLVSWHSFDNDSLTDQARIPLPAVADSITYVTGRVNQAIRFSSIGSYYQV